MRSQTKLFILIFLGIFLFSFQHPELEKLRSLHQNDEGNDSLRCAYYGEMGYYHAFRNYDSSRYYLKKALGCSELIDNKYLVTRYYNFLGMCYAVNGNLDSSIYAFKTSSKIAKQASLDSTLAQSLYGLGNVYHTKGDMSLSLDSYLEALSYFEEQGFEKSIFSTKANISQIYLTLEEYGKAKELVLETNSFYKKNGIETGLRNGYKRISYILKHEGELDSAYYYLKLAHDLAVKHNDSFAIGVIDNGIGDVLFKQGKYNEALAYLKNGIKHHESIKGEQEELIFIYSNLSFCYAVIGDKEESRKAMDQANELLVGTESVEYKIFYYNSKYKVDSVFGDFESALAANQQVLSLNKELLDQEKAEQVNNLQIKYETEKKEIEIASLSQQASIQALEIQQKNQAIIIGLITILFILGAVYFVYKQRVVKRKQSQTELEQRFLRSQLNPHFISNALVAVQSFMLKNDSESAALYLTKFSKLMREILENSRREFIPVEEELNMLTNYLDIHKLRLGSFDFSIELDENIDSEVDTIPPMFVQPFVENAVEHGIINANGKGKIEVKFKKDGDYISIEVSDNGGGLIKKETRPEHTSLSSTIIKERMDLFNQSLKRKIQLVIGEIRSENGEVSGTKVELKVPFSYI